MSREGAPSQQDQREKPERAAGTPIWVWLVYVLGGLGAAVFAFSGLFTLGALVLSNDVPVGADVSTPAVVLWGALIVVAVVTWILRRRSRR